MTTATTPGRNQANLFILQFQHDESWLLTGHPHFGHVVSVAIAPLPSVAPSSTPPSAILGTPDSRRRKHTSRISTVTLLLRYFLDRNCSRRVGLRAPKQKRGPYRERLVVGESFLLWPILLLSKLSSCEQAPKQSLPSAQGPLSNPVHVEVEDRRGVERQQLADD
jgi:hypothetical protein